jgi:sucrose-6-phosphate hydrolase SacC (GH32 family)
VAAGVAHTIQVPSGALRQAEVIVSFAIPTQKTTLALTFGDFGYQTALSCTVDFTPNHNSSFAYYEVPVACGPSKDTLRILTTETSISIRAFLDATFAEVFFQNGRVAITEVVALTDASMLALTTSSASATAQSIAVYLMASIWVSPEEVRNAPRVYK